MREILALAGSRIEQGLPIGREDEAFHLAIAAATKNNVLLRIIKVFYLMSRSRRTVYFSDIQRSRQSHLQHQRLYEAIEAKDVAGAAGLMKKHLKEGELVWENIFGKKGARAGAPSRSNHTGT